VLTIDDVQMRNRLKTPDEAQDDTSISEDDVYSKMHYKQGEVLFFEYIEPLVGLLRDPLTMCGFDQRLMGTFDRLEDEQQSKRWILLAPSAASRRHVAARRPRTARRLLFDIGASLYSVPAGILAYTGTKWFVERYAAFNLSFDQIYAFEYGPKVQADVFDDMPVRVLARYSYYNVGVQSDERSVWNFWHFVREVATVEDHVSVKLDIDSPGLEEAFVEQIKRSPSIMQLVDEMFYEDHVNSLVMRPYWGYENRRRINDTYGDFLYLRQHGVRMHSWP